MKSPLPFLVALTLLGGCFSLPTGPPPDLSTPYKTLAFLRDSYVNLDYSGVLYTLDDTGDFVFAFDQHEWGDIVNGHPIPIDWGIYSERIATQNMFDEAVDINFFEFWLEDMKPLPEGATHYTSGPIYYRIIYYYNEDYDSHYITGYANFDMQKQGEDWIITRWNDQKVGEHSWGWLKFLYRYL
jgi:hypothetical protein